MLKYYPLHNSYGAFLESESPNESFLKIHGQTYYRLFEMICTWLNDNKKLLHTINLDYRWRYSIDFWRFDIPAENRRLVIYPTYDMHSMIIVLRRYRDSCATLDMCDPNFFLQLKDLAKLAAQR